MKQRILNAALWLAYILALVASLGHVAATFNRFEQPGAQYAGWLAAIAVDIGLAALAYAIQQRRRAHRSVRLLWLGVTLFASISAYANVLHALSVSPATLFSAIVFSATLPMLVVYLGEIVSSDDAAQADAIERDLRRSERETARLAEIAATQAALAKSQANTVASQVAQVATLSDAQPKANNANAEPSVFLCETCEREFTSRFALSAHAKAHKNGRVVAATPESDTVA